MFPQTNPTQSLDEEDAVFTAATRGTYRQELFFCWTQHKKVYINPLVHIGEPEVEAKEEKLTRLISSQDGINVSEAFRKYR